MGNEKNRIDDAELEKVAGGASGKEMVTVQLNCPDCGTFSGILEEIGTETLSSISLRGEALKQEKLWSMGNNRQGYDWICPTCGLRIVGGSIVIATSKRRRPANM